MRPLILLASLLFSSLLFAQDANPDATVETTAQEQPANPKVLFETTAGSFTVELFINEAPKTVENFLTYVDSGFYKGTIFHRVLPNFMIQAGGFTKELAKKETRKAIKNEASEQLKNTRGTIAMARLSAPGTATSQFFINMQDNPHLNWRSWNVGYAVFGKVDDFDMNIIDNISFSRTGTIGIHRNVPIEAVEILNVSRVNPWFN